MAHTNEVPGGGLSSVSAKKRDMKHDESTKKLASLRIRAGKSGFALSKEFQHSGDPMRYIRDEELFFDDYDEAQAATTACLKQLWKDSGQSMKSDKHTKDNDRY